MDSRLRKIEQRMKQSRENHTGEMVLFLDFDGVVNVPYRAGTPEYEDAMERGVYDFFRPEIVARLNRLIRDYDLSVVISSSWRSMGIDFCLDSMRNAGFDSSVRVRGITPFPDDYPPRCEEILMYLEGESDISGFVILDDIDMKLLRPYAVQTEFEEGYTEACDKQARTILERLKLSENTASMHAVLFVALAVTVTILIIFIAIKY